MSSELFKKYNSRIAKEGVLKALLCGLSIGFSALILCGGLSWFFGFKEGLWVSLALLVVCTAAATPLFYYFKFRPTAKAIAKRVDELGLEERVLTMSELENDTSYIAMKQREDTVKALGTVNHMLIKIAVSVSLVVAIAVTGFVGFGMMTVDSLHYAGVIPSGMQLLSKEAVLRSYTLSSQVASGCEGYIAYYPEDGRWDSLTMIAAEDTIKVEEGEDAPAVIALAKEGWIFVGWSDGIATPYRHDVSVGSNIKVNAIFEALKDEMPDDDEGELPENGNGGDGSGSDNSPGSSSSQPSGDPSEGETGVGGMRNEGSQQIIDGGTYYGDRFHKAYEDAQDRMGQSNYSDEMKDWINDYYDTIEKNEKKEDSGEGSD